MGRFRVQVQEHWTDRGRERRIQGDVSVGVKGSDCRSAPICEEAKGDDLAIDVVDALVSDEGESFCTSSLEESGSGNYRYFAVQGPHPRWARNRWAIGQRIRIRTNGRLMRLIMEMMGEVKKRNPGVDGETREVMFIFRQVDKRPYVDIYVGRVQTRSFDWKFIKMIMMVSVLYHPRHERWIRLSRLGDVDWRDLGVRWISWALPDINSEFANHTQIKICFQYFIVYVVSLFIPKQQTTMTGGLVKIYQIGKDGARFPAGMIAKDSIDDVQVNQVMLAPLDPDDPEGKLRLQVPDDQKERMMVIKIYKKGTPVLRANKNGEMEVVPYRTLWYKWEAGEKERDLLMKALE